MFDKYTSELKSLLGKLQEYLTSAYFHLYLIIDSERISKVTRFLNFTKFINFKNQE